MLTIEEHGGGKQLLRFRIWAKYPVASIVLSIALGVLSGAAAADSSYVASLILGFSSALLIVTCSADKARAMYELSNAFSLLGETYQLADPSPEKSSKQLETLTEAPATPVYLSRETGLVDTGLSRERLSIERRVYADAEMTGNSLGLQPLDWARSLRKGSHRNR